MQILLISMIWCIFSILFCWYIYCFFCNWFLFSKYFLNFGYFLVVPLFCNYAILRLIYYLFFCKFSQFRKCICLILVCVYGMYLLFFNVTLCSLIDLETPGITTKIEVLKSGCLKCPLDRHLLVGLKETTVQFKETSVSVTSLLNLELANWHDADFAHWFIW